MTAWRLAHTVALETWNGEAIVGQLAEDVVIRVAVHDAPTQGHDITSADAPSHPLSPS